MTIPDGDSIHPIHETRSAGIDNAEQPPQAPEPHGAPRMHPSWQFVNNDPLGDDGRNLNFPQAGDFNFPPVDRSNPNPDDYPTTELTSITERNDIDDAGFNPRPDPPPFAAIPVGLQARAIAAGLRWLYKENEAGEIVPRKGVVRTAAIGGIAVMGTLVGLRYGSEIAHSFQNLSHEFIFGGSSGGASHAAASPDVFTQTSAPAPGNTAVHDAVTSTGAHPASTSPKPAPSGGASKSGKAMPTQNAPVTAQKPDKGLPQPPPASAAPAPSSETVVIGTHHKDSVWGELRAQNPNWTNAQIASAIDKTQQATGQNLSHVTAGEQIKLLAPQAPATAVTPAEHAAQLHAHGVHGGNVAPIQQPAGSSVVYLQTGAAHNSVNAVVAQALQSNNLSKPAKFNKLVTGVVNYNHMQDVDEHSLPVGWPVYIPPEAMLRHILEEIGK